MTNAKYSRELDISNPMGIPAYDSIVNVYDSDQNLTLVTYSLDSKPVAVISLSYDANGNILTAARTS